MRAARSVAALSEPAQGAGRIFRREPGELRLVRRRHLEAHRSDALTVGAARDWLTGSEEHRAAREDAHLMDMSFDVKVPRQGRDACALLNRISCSYTSDVKRAACLYRLAKRGGRVSGPISPSLRMRKNRLFMVP